MTGRFRAQHIRLVARAMLLAWLLALGVGWVNACVVQGGGVPEGGPPHHGVVAAAAVPPGDGHLADTGSLACQSFCNAAQGGVAKTPLHDLGNPSLPAPAVDERWSAWPAGPGPDRARAALAPLPPQPAVAIVFLRLTI